MIKKKLKLYYKFLIQNLFLLIYGKILIPRSTKNFIEKTKINKSFFRTYKNKSYYLYKIKNARIYTDNNQNSAIIKNNSILPYVSFQQVDGKLKSIKYNSVIKKGTPSFIKKIKGKVFNLSQGASGNNYFHFLFDIIPKIYLLNSKININEIDYFYISDPKIWQINILKILGVNKDQLLSSKKNNHIYADEVYAVDHPWYNSGYVHSEVKKIPQWIIYKHRKNFLKKSKKNFSKKIFLDRSQSQYNHCQIHNLSEINTLITKKKFKSYKPELLSFKNQMYLFKSSSVVIGAHGASLANIIFCRPKTKIIEIIPSDHPNKKCERISKILKLRYFRVKTKPDNSDINYPFKIHLNKKILKKIETIIDIK